MLLVKRLTENAILPVRGSKLAAGYDLSAAEAKVVPAHGKALVKTDLAMAIPEGHYGRVGAYPANTQRPRARAPSR